MLQRAALATLKIAAESLESGFILKDATPYNIQFEGPRAVFIDFGSFAPYVEGQPWAAYSQFCRMFLNPLIVQAYGGIPFRPWLRGEMDGITPAQANRALGLRHKLRWAPLVHVTLQSWLDKSKLAEGLTEAPRPVSKRTLARLLGSLRGFVSKLKPRPEHSPWAVYGDDPGYQQEAQAAKCAFIERTLDRVKPSMVWDLGCNTGTYALLAARRSKAVVAMDRDEAAVSVLYRLAAQDAPNVLPLVMDLCNPSPNRGWAQAERKGLAERGPADVVLCLALLHHLVLDAGIPLPAVLEWLAGIGRSAIIEYPSPEDPRVRQLLARKAGIRQWPAEQEFRVLLSERLDVLETTALPKSARTLLLVKPGISRDNS
jgi:SAM-dependent methyltransferase